MSPPTLPIQGQIIKVNFHFIWREESVLRLLIPLFRIFIFFVVILSRFGHPLYRFLVCVPSRTPHRITFYFLLLFSEERFLSLPRFTYNKKNCLNIRKFVSTTTKLNRFVPNVRFFSALPFFPLEKSHQFGILFVWLFFLVVFALFLCRLVISRRLCLYMSISVLFGDLDYISISIFAVGFMLKIE